MTFLGMGTLEVLVILLVAFIFLGPERLSAAGRTLGKLVGQARQMTSDMSSMVMAEEDGVSHPRPAAMGRESGEAPSAPGGKTRQNPDDGPVAFRRAPEPSSEENTETPRRFRTH